MSTINSLAISTFTFIWLHVTQRLIQTKAFFILFTKNEDKKKTNRIFSSTQNFRKVYIIHLNFELNNIGIIIISSFFFYFIFKVLI